MTPRWLGHVLAGSAHEKLQLVKSIGNTAVRIGTNEGLILDVLEPDRLDLVWYSQLLEKNNDLYGYIGCD